MKTTDLEHFIATVIVTLGFLLSLSSVHINQNKKRNSVRKENIFWANLAIEYDKLK